MRTFAADFHEAMAILLLGQGQAARAEAHLRQVLRVAPAQPVGYQRLAAFYIHAGRLPEARELLTTLVSLQPNEASGHVNLATLLLQLREYSAAVQELERALEISPKQPEALQNLALLYLNTRSRLPEALDLCQRLAVCQPKASSYDLLGWAFYANGRTNEALEASGKAVACEPDNAVYRERHRRLELVAGAAQPTADGKAGDSKP
jgi:Flp pilus assembly protein TadD